MIKRGLVVTAIVVAVSIGFFLGGRSRFSVTAPSTTSAHSSSQAQLPAAISTPDPVQAAINANPSLAAVPRSVLQERLAHPLVYPTPIDMTTLGIGGAALPNEPGSPAIRPIVAAQAGDPDRTHLWPGTGGSVPRGNCVQVLSQQSTPCWSRAARAVYHGCPGKLDAPILDSPS
jgi:hypothetical protein